MLDKDQVLVFLLKPDEIPDDQVYAEYTTLLSIEEMQRLSAIKLKAHQRQFIISRALIRTTLSSVAGLEPAKWQFQFNSYGKPEILQAQNDNEIRFNLSHTQGLIACAMTLQNNIGVDVETDNRSNDLMAIAKRFFSKEEIKQLDACDEQQYRRLFFKLWTLKEAYAKAIGKGLALSLSQFYFDVHVPNQITLYTSNKRNQPDNDFRFFSYTDLFDSYLAIAVHKSGTCDVVLQKVLNIKSLALERVPS